MAAPRGPAKSSSSGSGAQGHGGVVFRGRVASYRHSEVWPCTAYRYTIVNYDRRDRRSTGVPTTVLT